VFDAVLDELGSVVFGFIQSDNMRNSEVFEDLNVILRLVAPRLLLVIHRPHKGYELSWDNPI
jgi:hypothetical protein